MTIDEMVEMLRNKEVKFRVEHGGLIRSPLEYRPLFGACPLCAALMATTGELIPNNHYSIAAKRLGISESLADDIVVAADYDVPMNDGRRYDIRQKLLTLVGFSAVPPPKNTEVGDAAA